MSQQWQRLMSAKLTFSTSTSSCQRTAPPSAHSSLTNSIRHCYWMLPALYRHKERWQPKYSYLQAASQGLCWNTYQHQQNLNENIAQYCQWSSDIRWSNMPVSLHIIWRLCMCNISPIEIFIKYLELIVPWRYLFVTGDDDVLSGKFYSSGSPHCGYSLAVIYRVRTTRFISRYSNPSLSQFK